MPHPQILQIHPDERGTSDQKIAASNVSAIEFGEQRETLLKFVRRVVPEQGYKVAAVAGRAQPGQGPFKNLFFETHDQLVDKLLATDAANETAYFAVCGYHNRDDRTQANSSFARSFWIDVDCGADKAAAGKGYATKNDAAAAIQRFCVNLGLPIPMVVDSGNGLHCYWPLTQDIDAETWTRTARQFKAVLDGYGVKADPSRTADRASILRPPNTHNRKDPNNPKLVQVKRWADPIPHALFAEKIDKAAHALTSQKQSHEVSDNADLTAHLTSQQPALTEFDRMLTYIDPGLSRSDWVGVLMAAADTYGEEARGLCASWSAGKSHGNRKPDNYDADDVQRQYTDALKRNASHEGNRYTINGHVRRLAEAGKPLQREADLQIMYRLTWYSPLRCKPGSEQRSRTCRFQGLKGICGCHLGRIQIGIEYQAETESQTSGRGVRGSERHREIDKGYSVFQCFRA